MTDHEIVPVLPSIGDWPTCAGCGRNIGWSPGVGWVHRTVKS